MIYTKKEIIMATAIFYASSTGNTELISKIIAKELGDIELVDIADHGVSGMNDYENIILGIATWGDGELQDDWDEEWDNFKEIDFSKKTVALFGLGDQEGYGENYLDAMGIVYEHLIEVDTNIVGKWAVTSEYFHDESRAIVDDMFVGLALDEDNQDDLSGERIIKWCESINKDIL
jgi:flavodoxin I